MSPTRRVYVISDLHLGGVHGAGTGPDDRGFRLCTQVETLTAFVDALSELPGDTPRTELVINGDFVDFLAERHDVEGSASPWMPFIANPKKAADTLEKIVARDRQFFDALTRFLHRGHRLVVLLGNHDLELSLPCVRQKLREKFQVCGGHDFEFLYDGEAYVVGDALIEHGNRRDPWNRVDHGSLRRFRSRQSRHRPEVAAGRFTPPPGSRLVSEVINPIKADYRFVDLLKPETGAVVPLLLALEPRYRRQVTTLAALCAAQISASVRSTVTGDIASNRSSSESFGGDLAARPNEPSGGSYRPANADALRALLEDLMPGESDRFLASIDDGASGDIAAGDVARGWIRLLASDRRLPALRLALAALEKHQPVDRGTESSAYLEAAAELIGRGFRFVIFGHTHRARDLQVGTGRYLNTGTWADIIQFPAEILRPGNESMFHTFVEDMKEGALNKWVTFRPTYVRLDLSDTGVVAGAELVEYARGDQV